MIGVSYNMQTGTQLAHVFLIVTKKKDDRYFSGIMGSKRLIFFNFNWVVLAFVVIVLPLTTESQNQVCSIQGIDLVLCLNQKNGSLYIDGTCCKVLNKVVRAGYNCLCLLMASTFPLLSTPISLPLSNCFISVPPLTLCKVVTPMPIMNPPNSTNNQPKQPSVPSIDVPASPPQEMQFPSNSTSKNSSTTLANQPPSGGNAAISPPQDVQASSNSSGNNSTEMAATHPPVGEITSPKSTMYKHENETSNGGDKGKIIVCQCLFFCLALLCCIIFA